MEKRSFKCGGWVTRCMSQRDTVVYVDVGKIYGSVWISDQWMQQSVMGTLRCYRSSNFYHLAISLLSSDNHIESSQKM